MDQTHFIHEVARRLGCDERRAESVVFIVFHELRDRITPKEAEDVAAQLPGGLKRIWLEGNNPGRWVERIHRAEFIGRVWSRALLPDDVEAERTVKVVFGMLQHALGSPTGKEGEAWDIFSQLPKDLKVLWLAASEQV